MRFDLLIVCLGINYVLCSNSDEVKYSQCKSSVFNLFGNYYQFMILRQSKFLNPANVHIHDDTVRYSSRMNIHIKQYNASSKHDIGLTKSPGILQESEIKTENGNIFMSDGKVYLKNVTLYANANLKVEKIAADLKSQILFMITRKPNNSTRLVTLHLDSKKSGRIMEKLEGYNLQSISVDQNNGNIVLGAEGCLIKLVKKKTDPCILNIIEPFNAALADIENNSKCSNISNYLNQLSSAHRKAIQAIQTVLSHDLAESEMSKRKILQLGEQILYILNAFNELPPTDSTVFSSKIRYADVPTEDTRNYECAVTSEFDENELKRNQLNFINRQISENLKVLSNEALTEDEKNEINDRYNLEE